MIAQCKNIAYTLIHVSIHALVLSATLPILIDALPLKSNGEASFCNPTVA